MTTPGPTPPAPPTPPTPRETTVKVDAGLIKLIENVYERFGMDAKKGREGFLKSLAELKAIERDFSYLGFDPTVIAAKVAAVETWNTDIVEMIVLYLLRGTSLRSIQSRMSRRGAERIDDLRRKYSLRDRVGRANDKSTVTLGRIASAFPVHCMVIAMKLSDFRVVSDFPGNKIVQISSFMSIVAAEDEWRVAFACAWKCDEVFNPAKFADRTKRVYSYAMAARMGNTVEIKEATELKLAADIYALKGLALSHSVSFDLVQGHAEQYIKDNNIDIPKFTKFMCKTGAKIESVKDLLRRRDDYDDVPEE